MSNEGSAAATGCVSLCPQEEPQRDVLQTSEECQGEQAGRRTQAGEMNTVD